MQPASAAEIQPAISLLGKTQQLLKTLLGLGKVFQSTALTADGI
jgi:hypothetical protein